MHTPATHEVVPFGFVHFAPQALQLFTFVCVSVSHPLAGLPSQSAKPGLQDGLHAPETQDVLPWSLEHTVAHAPQCAVVLSCTSQPVAALLSQLPKPGLQEIEQLPKLHEGVPLVALHAAPQLPQ
jgi:hypothetical protein